MKFAEFAGPTGPQHLKHFSAPEKDLVHPNAPDKKCQQTETTCTILRIVHYRLVNLISWKLLAPLVPNTLNVSPHRKRNWPTPIAPDEKCQQTETTCTILRIVHYRWAILILRLPTEIGHKFDEIIYWEKTGRNSSKRNIYKIVIFALKNRHITEKK